MTPSARGKNNQHQILRPEQHELASVKKIIFLLAVAGVILKNEKLATL